MVLSLLGAPATPLQQLRRSSPSERLTRRWLGRLSFMAIAVTMILNCASTPSARPPANDNGLGCTSELHGRYPVKRSWLKQQVTVGEAEATVLRDDPGLKPEDNPLLPDWTRLKKSMQPGDQIWLFAGCPLGPPPDPLPPGAMFLCGDVGYALIRGCEVVDHVIIGMS